MDNKIDKPVSKSGKIILIIGIAGILLLVLSVLMLVLFFLGKVNLSVNFLTFFSFIVFSAVVYAIKTSLPKEPL